ncbi:hypothetical protein [Marivirga sericea]|uniref:hypothetical protein n=1 Tax=Marivirga sericea TaxID=1028 RepID=UPI00111C80B2|nr:hypothetical protein [Marivirga sericea]
MRLICLIFFFSVGVFLSCTSSKTKRKVAANKQEVDKESKVDAFFAETIPPEYARVKAEIIREIQPDEVSETGVTIHFLIKDVLGYGSSFSTTLSDNDTLSAIAKFGYGTISRNSLESMKSGTIFKAEIEGNPIIANRYTIYKLLLTD